MEVQAKFHSRIATLAVCVLTGVVGAAVLYYGMFLVLALVNYFDGFYKHDTFYARYPRAITYLTTFFSAGTLKHLPGYEIEINFGIPLLFGCGMIFLGILLALLMRNNTLAVCDQQILGKDILQKCLDAPLSQLQHVRRLPFGGVLLTVGGKRHLYLLIKNRAQLLDAMAGERTT